MSKEQTDILSTVGVVRCALAVTLISSLSLGMSGCNADPLEAPAETDMELGVSTQAITYNGHDYLLVTTATNWGQARSYCQSAGYELVSVNDATEENFLHSEQLKKAPYDTKWWIGLYDSGIEGSWFWTDNSPFGYANWWPGQPDAKYSNEDCTVDGWGSQWNDWGCENAAYFICERSSVSDSYTGAFYYSASNTSNATTNTSQWSIFAYAGQVVTVGTCGLAGAAVFSGNTWLRMRNTVGVEFASNNDSCSSVASNISFVAPTTGHYTIHAGCYSTGGCSGAVAYKVGP
jgi:hypothetical protein